MWPPHSECCRVSINNVSRFRCELSSGSHPLTRPLVSSRKKKTVNLSKTQKGIFATLFLIGLLANIEKGIVGVIGPYLMDGDYMGALGLKTFNGSQLGLITTLFYVSFIVMTFGAGWFVDKFGYRKFIPAALAVLLVGCLFFGFAGYSSTAAIFILIPLARLVIGFGQAGYTNGAPPIIAKNFAAQQRGSVQGNVVATAGIGTILCYLVLDPLVVRYDFRYVYFLLVLLIAVALVMFWVLVPSDENAVMAAEASPQGKKPEVKFSEAWTNRNTLVLALALLINNLVGVGLLSWASTMYAKQFGLTYTQKIIILSMYGVSLYIATSTGPTLIKKYFDKQERKFMLLTSCCGGVLLLGTVLIGNLWTSAVCLWLSNLMIMWAFSGILVLPYRLIPLRIIGSAFAVINIGAFVGGLLQGVGIGFLFDATGGFIVPFVALGVLAVIGGVVPYLLKEVDTTAA